MYFGSTVDTPTSFELLDAFVEAGGTFFDTANCYSFWVAGGTGDESEQVLGDWMRARGNRSDIVLSTKVGCRPRYPGAAFPAESEGLHPDTIVTAVDDSLRRLGTDHIDLLYAHRDDHDVPLDVTLEAFAELIAAGKVGAVAGSNITADRLADAPGYAAVQLRHSFVRPLDGADLGVQLPLDDDHRELALERDVRLVGYSPLVQGAYTRSDRPWPAEYDTDANTRRLAALDAVVAETGHDRNTVVLAWMLRGEPAVIPVIAASQREQLDQNLAAANVGLDPDQLQQLDRAHRM
jgi:aryl-alcohol dehydrogenase-like predicted oxidoreductase